MSGNPAEILRLLCEKLGFAPAELGVIVVDHGSRREASNRSLLEVVASFQANSPYQLVEPAHMDLAEPSIATAFDRLIAAGARFVIIHPYFLLPGRHWARDVPALAAAAAAKHHGVGHLVSAPLGIHPLISQVMNDRILHCLQHWAGEAEACDVCDPPSGRCRG